ncbi:MAG: hypothetical protein ABJZ55_16070 [Fuerstiella sp.]
MIPVGITVETELLTKRGLGVIKKLANKERAHAHIAENLPRRFENNADTRPGGELGYARRTRSYMIRKARLFGHQRPLVLTGDLSTSVLSSARVTATQKRAKVIARGSRTSVLRQQFKSEIEAITEQEQEGHREAWVETFGLLAQSQKYQKKQKVS